MIQLDPLVFVGKHLADQLVAGLAAEGRVCTRLVVTAETDHGERSERAWYRAAGMSAPAMVERVRWQLDAWLESGDVTAGVVLLRLMPDEVRGDDGDQLRLWGGPSDADERATRAVARLTGMVGDRAVLVPAWRGGRLPGDRYDWVPASTTDLTDADDTAERLRPASAAVGDGAGPWPGSLPTPSPAVVPAEVQPAELADADGRPVLVSGRGELSADPGDAGHRRAAGPGDHRVGRAVAARRALVGAPPPPPPGPLPGRHGRRRRPPRPRRAPPLVGRRLLRLTS